MLFWFIYLLFFFLLIVGVIIVFWVMLLLLEFIIVLLFFVVVMMVKIVLLEVIFGGFVFLVFWLVFSGFVFGIVICKIGLVDWVVQVLLVRFIDFWLWMVVSVVFLSYVLVFVMFFNMGCIVLLMLIVVVMVCCVGIVDGSCGWFGLVLVVGFGIFQLLVMILFVNVLNLVMSGVVEGLYGIYLNYVFYLLLYMLVFGWLKGVVLVVLICWFFFGKLYLLCDLVLLLLMSCDEKCLVWLLVVVFLLWVIESWYGVGLVWIGLVVVVIMLLLWVGFINGEEFVSGVNMCICIYVVGILGLVIVVI